MKESIEMQNEFEEIIQELKKLKSTNENLSEFKKSIGLAAESLIEVDKKTIELFQRSQVLIGSFDKFIEKYKSILEEQIDDLKREIRDLKKLRKELDIEGIVSAAKTELIDAFNAKTETLLEKLGGLGVAVKSVAEQTEATHKMCTKEFTALSEKVSEESTRLNAQVQAVQSNTQAVIKTIDQIDFPTQFKNIESELKEIIEGVGYVQNELKSLRQQISRISDGVDLIESLQNENLRFLEKMDQRILTIENRTVSMSNKIESNQKAQRLQFIILLVVIVGSWIVLMLK